MERPGAIYASIRPLFRTLERRCRDATPPRRRDTMSHEGMTCPRMSRLSHELVRPQIQRIHGLGAVAFLAAYQRLGKYSATTTSVVTA